MTGEQDLYLGLGSNLGDRKKNLHEALEMLDRVRDYALAELAGEEGCPR